MDIMDIGIANSYTENLVKSAMTGVGSGGTKVEKSSINGNIKIDGVENIVYKHPTGTNPHGTTKSDVGLGNVDNTSDLNKPISTATKTALDGKSSTAHTHTNYVEKVAGRSLVDDAKIAKIDELANTTIPTKTSELTNDSKFVSETEIADFQTSTQVTDIVNNLLSEMKTEIISLIERVTALESKESV